MTLAGAPPPTTKWEAWQYSVIASDIKLESERNSAKLEAMQTPLCHPLWLCESNNPEWLTAEQTQKVCTHAQWYPVWTSTMAVRIASTETHHKQEYI